MCMQDHTAPRGERPYALRMDPGYYDSVLCSRQFLTVNQVKRERVSRMDSYQRVTVAGWMKVYPEGIPLIIVLSLILAYISELR